MISNNQAGTLQMFFWSCKRGTKIVTELRKLTKKVWKYFPIKSCKLAQFGNIVIIIKKKKKTDCDLNTTGGFFFLKRILGPKVVGETKEFEQ